MLRCFISRKNRSTRSASSPSQSPTVPDSPFCRCATSSPGAGEVFPQRESLWQSTQTLSLCQGLSLWERWHRAAMTERASPFSTVPHSFATPPVKRRLERSAERDKREIKNNLSAVYAQSKRGAHYKSFYLPEKPLHKILCSGLFAPCGSPY